jgi:hypothetical protein
MQYMNTISIKDLKVTSKGLESLISIAKKQLLMIRIQEAEKNFASKRYTVSKNSRDIVS